MGAVPILRLGAVLVATLGDQIDDVTALELQRAIGQRVVDEHATGVLLDISALEVVDSFICRVLGETARIVRVLGARTAVVGMRPVVAITLVELGEPLAGVASALTIEQGMAMVTGPDGATRTPGRRPLPRPRR